MLVLYTSPTNLSRNSQSKPPLLVYLHKLHKSAQMCRSVKTKKPCSINSFAAKLYANIFGVQTLFGHYAKKSPAAVIPARGIFHHFSCCAAMPPRSISCVLPPLTEMPKSSSTLLRSRRIMVSITRISLSRSMVLAL